MEKIFFDYDIQKFFPILYVVVLGIVSLFLIRFEDRLDREEAIGYAGISIGIMDLVGVILGYEY